tara:strand:- start:489 stop:1544 length:1056 start_codon:yes stop_codon:yes gene_type:complete
MEELNTEDFAAGWEILETKKADHKYVHYIPLSEAAKATVSEAQDQHRVFTGIPTFDAEMRGIGRRHLCNIVGYSHSGKTLVLLHMLMANKEKRIAYFCPDETQSLILVKLTSIITGVGAKELEQRIANGDSEAIHLLMETATEYFPNLAVFEDGLTPSRMDAAYDELTEDVWGDEADMVIVDYVDLMEDCGDTPPQKFNWLKAWGKRRNVPLILIHQTSRSAGASGKAMTISSGNFGGEQHATFQIGVRRKKNSIMEELAEQRSKASPNVEKIADLQHSLLEHEYTITLNLVKNKRPGGACVDETDMELDVSTGALHLMAHGDKPYQWQQQHSLHAKEEASKQEAIQDDMF